MKPIYDTMTGGLELSTDLETYNRICALKSKEGKASVESKDGKLTAFGYKCKRDERSSTLSVSLYNGPKSDKWFTTFTVSWRTSGQNRFVNVKANGTAISNIEFAIRPSKVGVISTLIAPFQILEEIYGVIYSDDVWDNKIAAGEIAIQDLEIAFPWKIEHEGKIIDKQKIIRILAALYKRDMVLTDTHINLGQHLNIRTTLYPERMQSINDPFTGVMLQKFDGTNRILTLNVYDKRAQMKDTDREIPKDMPGEWADSPRFDIRLFRRELGIILGKKATIKHWAEHVKTYDTLDDFKRALLYRCLDRLYFFDLIKNSAPLRNALTEKDKKLAKKWQREVMFSGNSTYRNICDRENMSSELGGLAYDIVDYICKESHGTLDNLINRNLHRKAADTNNIPPARLWFIALSESVDIHPQGVAHAV